MQPISEIRNVKIKIDFFKSRDSTMTRPHAYIPS